MWLKNKEEPILEPIFRHLRFGVANKDLKNIITIDSVILDYGCGPEAKFYRYLKYKNIHYKKFYGIDPLIDIKLGSNYEFNKKLSVIRDNEVDLITMFAVLEHLPYPVYDYEQIFSKVKKGGYLLLTTPTKRAKYILEFLSYRLGMVSKREIEEHKHYFNLTEIIVVFEKFGFGISRCKIFELGMNNYALFQKKC